MSLSVANVSLGLLNYGYLGLYPTFLKSVLDPARRTG